MIRFIDIGKQIGLDEEWAREFAFFNTVSDLFLEFGGSQVWDCWEDLEQDVRFSGNQDILNRLKHLCPDWVFDAPDSPQKTKTIKNVEETL